MVCLLAVYPTECLYENVVIFTFGLWYKSVEVDFIRTIGICLTLLYVL